MAEERLNESSDTIRFFQLLTVASAFNSQRRSCHLQHEFAILAGMETKRTGNTGGPRLTARATEMTRLPYFKVREPAAFIVQGSRRGQTLSPQRPKDRQKPRST